MQEDDDRIAHLEAELKLLREACDRVMAAYDRQAVALFEMRKGLGAIADGSADPRDTARRLLKDGWDRVHAGRL
jgi:hypothetical protein